VATTPVEEELMRKLAVLLAVVAVGIAAALTPVAGASSVQAVQVNGSKTLVYQASPGEQNQLNVHRGNGTFSFEEFGGIPIQASAGSSCSHQLGLMQSTVVCSYAPAVQINLGDGNDYVNYMLEVPATFDGGTGDDGIWSYWGSDDLVRAGPGNDSVSTSGGNDTVYGDWGDDAIDGGEGADSLLGENGNDTLTGGGDEDYLDGGGGNDVLHGGYPGYPQAPDSWDQLVGGPNDDLLFGDGGNDWLDPGTGHDTIEGDAGVDTVTYATRKLPVRITLNGAGDDGDIASGENDLVKSDVESAVGGNGNDVLEGDAGANRLDGRGGADNIAGNAGDDVLVGAAGADRIDGGSGPDSLRGGTGEDELLAQDNQADEVICSEGTSEIDRAAVEWHDAMPQADCEAIDDGSQLIVDSVANVQATEGNGGPVQALFTFRLSHPSAVPVSVDYIAQSGTATVGSDFGITFGTLSFGAWEIEKTVAVDVYGDLVYEGDETFTVALVNPMSPLTLGSQSQALGTIVEDDPAPELSIGDASVQEGAGGKVTTVELEVSLSQASGHEVRVQYWSRDDTATAGADYGAVRGTLVFAPGDTKKTLPVDVYYDGHVEKDEQFLVDLNEPRFAVIADPEGVGTIVDAP
jgi:Ca2+-binding RTX toxin-like protein